tara:strand:- start:171 stop:374 length:204 start_codon:yes stop_codon:yes gene_type:complete
MIYIKMSVNLILLILVSLILLIVVGYKLYTVMFVPSAEQIRATANSFNNITHKSDFEKSVTYHTLDA